MRTARKLALIAAGYALSLVGGLIAVALNELFMPSEISQTSSGMVAFGDMILFVMVTGFLGLVPTWFLLKLCVEKAPRALVAVELVVAAIGPASWLAVTYFTGTPGDTNLPNLPQAGRELIGLFVAFAAIPRMVFGPVLLVIEAITFVLARERVARALLAVAMMMDLVPLSMFALHVVQASRL